MAADFTPIFTPYSGQGSFRFWAQKILPLVYDDSLSYYELLCKVVEFLNNVIHDMDTVEANTQALLEAYNELQGYVNAYFDNLDVQEEINAKLDEMAESGALNEILDPVIAQAVTNWIEENITPTEPPVDASLTISGAAADAKVTGDWLRNVFTRVSYVEDETTLLNVTTPSYMWVSSTQAKTLADDASQTGTTFPYSFTASSNWLITVDKFSGNFRRVTFRASNKNISYVGLTGANHQSHFNWYLDIDKTLSVDNMPANAKSVGDKIATLFNPIEYTSSVTLLSMPVPSFMWVTSAQAKTLADDASESETTFPYSFTASSYWFVTVDKFSGDFRRVTFRASNKNISYVGLTGVGHQDHCNWYLDVDKTLSVDNVPANAKSVGDKINALFNPVEYDNTVTLLNIPVPSFMWVTSAQAKTLADDASQSGTTFPYSFTAAGNWLVTVDKYSSDYRRVTFRASNKNISYVGLTGGTHESYFNWYLDVDKTLSVNNIPADAKSVGDKIATLFNRVEYDNTVTLLNVATPSYMWVSGTQAKTLADDASQTGTTFPYSFTAAGNWLVTVDKYSSDYRRVTFRASNKNISYVGLTGSTHENHFNWYLDVDKTLSVDNIPANAKSVGDKIAENRTLKILAFTSSFGYSTLGYLPQVITEVLPGINFTFAICYKSGGTIANHISMWNNDTPYDCYSKYSSKTGVWTNQTNSVTGKTAVRQEVWDAVIMQEYNQDLEGSESRINTFIDLISNYATNAIMYLYNITQAYTIHRPSNMWPVKYRDMEPHARQIAILEEHIELAESLMDGYYISDIIPSGVAVQNARTIPSIEALGNAATIDEPNGDLSNDDNGHLQNGLPVLIGAYTAAYKICQVFGYKPKIYSMQYNPTDENLATINYYCRTIHGECVGITDANKIAIEKCALAAIKHPYEITNMSAEDPANNG